MDGMAKNSLFFFRPFIEIFLLHIGFFLMSRIWTNGSEQDPNSHFTRYVPNDRIRFVHDSFVRMHENEAIRFRHRWCMLDFNRKIDVEVHTRINTLNDLFCVVFHLQARPAKYVPLLTTVWLLCRGYHQAPLCSSSAATPSPIKMSRIFNLRAFNQKPQELAKPVSLASGVGSSLLLARQ